MNEGWASYWHENLFLQDDRIEGHEVDFARTHAGVTSMPRVGLNPYALGMRLFYYIEQLVDKGKYSIGFKKFLMPKNANSLIPKPARERILYLSSAITLMILCLSIRLSIRTSSTNTSFL